MERTEENDAAGSRKRSKYKDCM